MPLPAPDREPPRGSAAVLADILTCVMFFTRLPVAALVPKAPGRAFADALWAAPVAGAIVGLLAGAVLVAALVLDFPAGVAAGLALAASVLVTGALHEDGLADVADGFGGGTTRERKLEIMRDSRIGTYGVCALALSFLLRWTALVAIANAGGADGALLALVAAHAASRAFLPAALAFMPSARPNGLGAGAGRPSAGTAMVAGLIGLAMLVPLGPGRGVLALVLVAGASLVLARSARRQIGGQTGDVLGAMQQIGEIAVLVAAAHLV